MMGLLDASNEISAFLTFSGQNRVFLLLLQALRHGDSHRDGRADHRVVAHAEEAHHLDVRGHGGGAGELSVGMHTAHGVGHAVAGGTGGHVVRMQGAGSKHII